MQIQLPDGSGRTRSYTLVGQPVQAPGHAFTSRIAFAAAHVVIDPLRTTDPAAPQLDWNRTLAFRRHLWSLGFGVAEAMDTAQRGMGLDFPLALELIQRTAAEARACNGRLASGAGTDHLSPHTEHTLQQITEAYLEQCEAIEATGSQIILMASRALARTARSVDDYEQVYGHVLTQLRAPAILHWLGPMFDPALAGYWGSPDVANALENCLRVLHAHSSRIDGIKISLLDAQLEITMRRRLPEGLRMYTGDDFNFDSLILGDDLGHSHALLGIFDPIAPVAARACAALDRADVAEYNTLLAPTIPLSRHIFQAPTFHYKTGIVFLAYLNGFQSHFRMVGGAESARSVPHLARLFELADAAGLLREPEAAVNRMNAFLKVAAG